MAVRYDKIDVPEWVATKFVVLPDGSLAGRAPCTNIGVFTYRKADGSVLRELRLPEEVFNPESMASLKHVPITIGHGNFVPNEDEIVGYTGDSPVCGENIYLSIDMKIYDSVAIEAIKNGTSYLSCAYSCSLEMSSGVWLGMPYDAIQRNIRYSHVALVDNPRAGETAQIRMDAADAVMADMAVDMVLQEDENMGVKDNVELKQQEQPDTAKEQVPVIEDNKNADKVEESTNVEVKENVVNVDAITAELNSVKKELADILTLKTKIEAERDTYKERIDAIEKELQEAKKSKIDVAVLNEMVNKRVKLFEIAKNLEVEVNDSMDNLEIEKRVIQKVFPKANFDGKDETYIHARFDSALEVIELKNDASVRVFNSPVTTVTDSTEENIVQKAKLEYIKRLKKTE